MRIFLFSITFLFLLPKLYSQDTITSTKDSITKPPLNDIIKLGDVYFVNAKKHDVKEIKLFMQNNCNNDSQIIGLLDQIKKEKKYKKTTSKIGVGLLIATVAAMSVPVALQTGPTDAVYIGMVSAGTLGAIGLGTSIVFQIQSMVHTKKAVNLYNEKF